MVLWLRVFYVRDHATRIGWAGVTLNRIQLNEDDESQARTGDFLFVLMFLDKYVVKI